jgi:N-acetylneuraminate synthase
MSIFFIAELGINHNGDLEIAKELIRVAKRCGCDAVKFQKRDIETVYTKEVLDSPRESPWGKTTRDQKNGLEFGLDEYLAIDDFCREQNIPWFASAWDLKSLNFLDKFNLPYAKLASAMLADENFMHALAARKAHTFMSTGLSTMDMVQNAVDIFRSHDCPFTLLHCVGTYPMKPEDANLKCMDTLRQKFNCPVGYSGHENGLAISHAAAALGAVAIERHITLDRTMYGSDQAASIEPRGIAMLIDAIRKIEAALGDGVKRFTDDEHLVAKKLRAHLAV